MWAGIPILIYLVERFLRLYRQTLRKTKIVFTEQLPGGVLAVYVTKPKRFQYKPGMYVFANCPRISRFEWHPYSLTSAPEDEYIRLHIAPLGDWSSAVASELSSEDILREQAESPLYHTISSTIKRTSSLMQQMADSTLNSTMSTTGLSTAMLRSIPDDLQLLVDGPYGAPAQNHDQYKVLCMVGAGIGITPFASVLRHIMHQFDDHRCIHCNKVGSPKY